MSRETLTPLTASKRRLVPTPKRTVCGFAVLEIISDSLTGSVTGSCVTGFTGSSTGASGSSTGSSSTTTGFSGSTGSSTTTGSSVTTGFSGSCGFSCGNSSSSSVTTTEQSDNIWSPLRSCHVLPPSSERRACFFCADDRFWFLRISRTAALSSPKYEYSTVAANFSQSTPPEETEILSGGYPRLFTI